MSHWITIAAALTGASGVLLGAFGAHGLSASFPDADLGTWRTAVLYHLLHAVALFALALYQRLDARLAHLAAAAEPGLRAPGSWPNVVAGAFVLGIVLFSGSLYLLSLKAFGFASVLGPVTPIGGVLLVTGWLALLYAAGKS